MRHDYFAVAGAVSGLHNKGWGVVAANESWHHADSAAFFEVHVGNVSCADKLVVHEHPSAVVACCLGGNFILVHLHN